jgi:5-methylcytosine-specific restriction enzyme subunit McrC
MPAASPVRTLVFTERVPRVCHLAPADVAFLLTTHPNHLELAPTATRGRYQVTPLGHVGVIVAPACRLVIRPKVPLSNLLLLLDPAVPLPSASVAVTPAPAIHLFDLLAGQFAHRLAERVAAGLHRDYTERSNQGPFLHGRLDLTAQLREAPGRKDRLHSRHDDLSADVACNQVPRATAERLLASPLLGEDVRAALRQALPAFEGVRPLPPAADAFTAVALDRLPEGYRPLFDLCRLLLEGLDPDERAGLTPAPAFLLDMERIFERYVTRGVLQAFADSKRHSVAVQPIFMVSPSRPGRPDVAMRPDVLIDHDGRRMLVVDAKWKRLPKAALVTADFYQMLAYATALGVPRAVLVYPGRHDRAWEYDFPGSPVRVTVRTLRVVGLGETCAVSLRRLGRALRRDAR